MVALTSKSIWHPDKGWLLPEVPSGSDTLYQLVVGSNSRYDSILQQLGYALDLRCFSPRASTCYYLGEFHDWRDLEARVDALDDAGISRSEIAVNPGRYFFWITKLVLSDIAIPCPTCGEFVQLDRYYCPHCIEPIPPLTD